MEYILGPKPGGCALCAYSTLEPADLAKNHVLLRLPDVLVCLNRYPFAAGHLLVLPRRHVGDALELPDAEYASLMRIAEIAGDQRVRRAVEVLVGPASGSTSARRPARRISPSTPTVTIVPRWMGDMNFMPVLAGHSRHAPAPGRYVPAARPLLRGFAGRYLSFHERT